MMQLFLAQLFFAALALAAPIADETAMAKAGGNAWQYGTGGGILGLIVLILDIIVFGSCISLRHDRPITTIGTVS